MTATKRKVGRSNGAPIWKCTKCRSAVAQQAVECWNCHAKFVPRDGAQRKDRETDLAYARRTLARHQANATRTANAIRTWLLKVRRLEAAQRSAQHGHEIRRRGFALK